MRTLPEIIFVVGNSRSGTTMLGRMLGLNKSVHTFPELHFFERYYGNPLNDARALEATSRMLRIEAEGFFGNSPIAKYHGEANQLLNNDRLHQPVDIYSRFITHALAKRNKQIACEQTPQNVFYTGEILQAFPDAKFINLVRDPRDVLLSQKNKWRRLKLGAQFSNRFESLRSRVNYQPITISTLWNAAVQAGLAFEANPNVITVRFEDLLANPEGTLRRICKHAGIEFSVEMLDVPQVGSSSGEDKPDRKGLNTDRAQSWKRGGLTKAELHLCQRVTSENMKRFGYEKVDVDASPWAVLGHYVSLPFKLLLALAFNIHRVGNIFDAVKRRLRSPRVHTNLH